jgi:hypothetical protein
MTDLYWEEYKLLQDKVDKLGSFRFQVKGWLITLVTGFLLTGIVTGIPWWAYIPAMLLIFSFSLLERRQREWELAFLSRLDELEMLLLSRTGEQVAFGIVAPRRVTRSTWLRPKTPAEAIEQRISNCGAVGTERCSCSKQIGGSTAFNILWSLSQSL